MTPTATETLTPVPEAPTETATETETVTPDLSQPLSMQQAPPGAAAGLRSRQVFGSAWQALWEMLLEPTDPTSSGAR
jgi:hypothetical protein